MNTIKNFKKLFLTGLLVVALPAFSMAQFGPRIGDWEMTIGGSGANDNSFNEFDGRLSATVGTYLTDEWLVSVRQGIGRAGGNTRGSTHVAADYHFRFDPRWLPFVGVNVGGFYGSGSSNTFSAGLEGGVKYYVHPQTFVFGMVEYHWQFSRTRFVADEFSDGVFLYSVGVGFNF
ncbi:MAG: outer membrane beta-barrel protein [Opitutales bacterium]